MENVNAHATGDHIAFINLLNMINGNSRAETPTHHLRERSWSIATEITTCFDWLPSKQKQMRMRGNLLTSSDEEKSHRSCFCHLKVSSVLVAFWGKVDDVTLKTSNWETWKCWVSGFEHKTIISWKQFVFKFGTKWKWNRKI